MIRMSGFQFTLLALYKHVNKLGIHTFYTALYDLAGMETWREGSRLQAVFAHLAKRMLMSEEHMYMQS